MLGGTGSVSGPALSPNPLDPRTGSVSSQALSPDRLDPRCMVGQGLSQAKLCPPTPLTQGWGLSRAKLSAHGVHLLPGLAPEMLMAQEPLLPKRRGPVDAADAAVGSPAKGPHLLVIACAPPPTGARDTASVLSMTVPRPERVQKLKTHSCAEKHQLSRDRCPGNHSSMAPKRRFPLRCRKSTSFPSHAPSSLLLKRRHCEEKQIRPDS